ncbi:MAG TPA: alpha-amylase family glycosyl hydrolase [Natronosporangium sp.]|nr:alpha-amylase family glycosyl hydrolase [Natronosporangium sp.]
MPRSRYPTGRVAAAMTAGALVLAGSVATSGPAAAGSPSLKSDLCYQVVTDRFADGNPGNNHPPSSPGLSDPTRQNWKLYWGGDFAGLTQQLDYLAELGVGAIWLSPHVDNINQPAVYGGVPNAGYHGYWTRDFFRTEEHFGTLAEFDALIAAAHARGIQVIMDWAPNHTSPADPADPGFAERGALYRDGVFVGDYLHDPHGYFHHNGGVSNWDDAYETQYHNLFDLADFNHQHPVIDAYHKDAVDYWLDRGVDGVRVDAVKHMTAGWQRSVADTILAEHDVFLFGEWYLGSKNDPLYGANVRFANDSGISVLDFYLNMAIRETFGQNASMHHLDQAISVTGADYRYPENLVTFIDNHDMPRFLTLQPDHHRLHQALAFLLTVRGTPCLYYGTEQYLHDDTAGGGDPYNRPMMPGFDRTTTAYQLVSTLADLRAQQPALAWGTHQQRWINNDVYIYERQFFNDVVLVAINKSAIPYQITGLRTALPAGTYPDVLGGLLGGGGISVGSGGGADRPVTPFTLDAGEVAVWSYRASEPSHPQLGSVAPTLTRAGNQLTIEGRGFGSSGTVRIGGVVAPVTSWSANRIVVTVPNGAPTGLRSVTVTTTGGTSNGYEVSVLSGPQVPVTFTVTGAPPTNWGDAIYLTGSVAELGHWSTDPEVAIGPMLTPNYPDWFIVASVPACTTIEFKFIRITAAGAVTWENGPNHVYQAPCSGTDAVTVPWQY